MRTSSSQFELMVEFMERYGDLNKPAEGPQGRLRATKLWTELTAALNLDVTGDHKGIDKWKKIQQAGPSTESVPSTSSVVEEVTSQPSTSFSDIQIMLPTRLSTPTPAPAPSASVDLQDLNITSGSVERSPRARVIPRRSAPRQNSTPRRITPRQVTTPRRAIPQRTVPRRITPRRAGTSSQTDAVAMLFEEQDRHWRRIFENVATQHMQLRERELEQQARLRERELEQQAVWQNLVTQCVTLLQQYLNK